jgi:hypothetical protein
MAILKIKLVAADGQALLGQTVKVSGCSPLQTNSEGLAQFLIESDVPLAIEVNSAEAWSGSSAQLAREELFQQVGTGFVRTGQ